MADDEDGRALTAELLAELEEALQAIIAGTGWGCVSIVVERWKPRRIERTERRVLRDPLPTE